MITQPMHIGQAYYQAMNAKDLAGTLQYLHSEIQLISPLGHISGKDAVTQAVKGFQSFIIQLTITETFGSADQAVIVYNLDCPAPVGSFRAVALMNFKDNLIIRIELFFDARPFEKK